MPSKGDAVLNILNMAVQYSNGTTAAVAAIAAGVNVIADAIGANRVTLAQTITALETQTDKTDTTVLGNIAKTKADMGL